MSISNPMHMGCRACGHSWDQPQELPREITAWVADLRAVKCPNCGADSKQLTIGGRK